MAKGDDAIRKKKNKKNRKKDSSSKVTNRVAAIIASKKRRLSGKRRMCQGMCFTLPTPEDPFNDRHQKVDFGKKEIKKPGPLKADHRFNTGKESVASRKGALDMNHMKVDNQEHNMVKVNKLVNEQKMLRRHVKNAGQKYGVKLGEAEIRLADEREAIHAQQGRADENTGCPSKFLILCLNTIEIALRQDGAFSSEEDKPLFVDPWGVKFWKCYSIGKYVAETSGASTTEQIGWMASTAADTIARKEKEGQSFTSPFLLFLVPSQEKAAKVRMVCKPLKALGIHTVSLHPGAPTDHQIHGLKSCEPEFLVSTPERLLELVSLKAVDISGVSFLVVDGLETLLKGGYLDVIQSIRQSISGDPYTVVFRDCSSYASIPVVQNLLQGSFCRLSFNDTITGQIQSGCIIQSVHVCGSEEERLSKLNGTCNLQE